ncbi:MAG: hypothetical protein PHH60_01555, partial [Candidatus Margulisbacteria bacterium]|nr:hypothetical protein [Candidatus Margulisiibacteriota bacterium]
MLEATRNVNEVQNMRRALPRFRPRLLPVQTGEVRVTQNDPEFLKLKGAGYENANKLINLLGKPKDYFGDSQPFEGVIFYRRLSGTHTVWVFRFIDLPKVAQILKQEIKGVKLEAVQPGEIRITSSDPDFGRLWGNTAENAQCLNSKKMLGDPAHCSEESKLLDGVLFARRLSGSNPVWVFQPDVFSGVAGLLKTGYDEVKLKEIQPGEVRVTHHDPEFSRLWGDTEKNEQSLKKELGDPEQCFEESKERGGVHFDRRLSGPNKVWVFQPDAFSGVAGLLKTGYDEVKLKEVQPGEVRVSCNDSEFRRLWGSPIKNVESLNSEGLLGHPEQCFKESKERGGVHFDRRLSGPNKVWVFQPTAFSGVAGLLKTGYDEVKLKEVQPEEIRVTRTDPEFVNLGGNNRRYAKALNSEDMLGDPERCSEESREQGGVCFNRRRSGSHKRWVYQPQDRLKVERYLIQKGVINEKQIFCWHEDFCLEVAGDQRRLAAIEQRMSFASNEERTVGLLLKRYGLIDQFRS